MNDHIGQAIFEEVQRHLERSSSEDPYSAFNTLWIGLLKAAQFAGGGNERAMVAGLLDLLPTEDLREILHSDAVNSLLELDPPIEAIETYVDGDERLNPELAQRYLEVIRTKREGEPGAAVEALMEIIFRIRNRREHGVKSVSGARDQEILKSAGSCLRDLCHAALKFAG